jgi:hypothetical protein
MGKHGNMKNRARFQMNQLNLVVMKEATEKFVGEKTEYVLEKGSQHHDFVGVGSGDVFILSRPPMEDSTGGEEMLLNKLKEWTLIHR